MYRPSVGLIVVLVSALLGVSGCAGFGPVSVNRDRFDYIQAIANSWKQQTLLNIVKMRYADTPVFLEVGQIISSYQLEGAMSLGGTVAFGSPALANDLLSLGTAGRYTDRPTITYTPMTGAHFLKVMMTPIPPPALFRLIESGWPVDILTQLGVQAINGVTNRKGGARGRAADPDFARLLEALRRIQASGMVGLRVEMSKETKREAVVLTFSQKDVPPEVLADQQLVRKLLGLRPDLREFRVIDGMVADQDDVVALQMRSAFQILVELGADIEVPPEHVAEQRTYPSIVAPDGQEQALSPITRIYSGITRPDDAFAAIKYRGYWYWVDDRDFKSKGVFTFLMVMMTLAEKEDKVPSAVVTIPAN